MVVRSGTATGKVPAPRAEVFDAFTDIDRLPERRISGALYAMVADARRLEAAKKADAGGHTGTTLSPAQPAHTPIHRLFGQATPEPAPRLRPTSARRPARATRTATARRST